MNDLYVLNCGTYTPNVGYGTVVELIYHTNELVYSLADSCVDTTIDPIVQCRLVRLSQ